MRLLPVKSVPVEAVAWATVTEAVIWKSPLAQVTEAVPGPTARRVTEPSPGSEAMATTAGLLELQAAEDAPVE